METTQSEHLKLTDDQIKQLICTLTSDLNDTKDFISELNYYIEDLALKVYKLKRHFCPEKFLSMKVSVGELSEMMEYQEHE